MTISTRPIPAILLASAGACPQEPELRSELALFEPSAAFPTLDFHTPDALKTKQSSQLATRNVCRSPMAGVSVGDDYYA